MLFGMSWKTLLWQGAAVAVALYAANTLATSNATVARIVRRNGIRVVPSAGAGATV